MNITTLETYAAHAWPAFETEHFDGWRLRCASGYTRRANTVLPFWAGTRDLDTKIAYCEAFYHRRGLPCGFKLTPAACPPELDAELERRGYTRQADTHVMTLDLTAAALPPETAALELRDEPDAAWLDAFCQFNATAAEHRPAITRLLAAIEPRRCFASLRHGDAIAAVGLGVQEDGYIGLFDIVVREDVRRQGLGRVLVSGLLRQAHASGATTAYLQVMANNQPAIQLYTQLGFRDVYPYWYRMKME